VSIKLSSVMVDDQAKALKSYTEALGFVKKTDVPVGEFRWLTVVSPDGPGDAELVLEPDNNTAAETYQQALFEQGIPLTAFAVDDIQREDTRLKKLGVAFRSEPTPMGPNTAAVFEDKCGTLIQIYQGRALLAGHAQSRRPRSTRHTVQVRGTRGGCRSRFPFRATNTRSHSRHTRAGCPAADPGRDLGKRAGLG
jgi:catechol 2,3-dioxygenase-like lactoylglutathione lyase family enzyme